MSTVKADNFTWRTGEATAQVSPSVTGQQIVRGVNKGWCFFNASSGTPVSSGSFNIASFTDNGVGNFTLNLSASLYSSGTACPVASAHASGVAWCACPITHAPSASTIAHVVVNVAATTYQDAFLNSVSISGY